MWAVFPSCDFVCCRFVSCALSLSKLVYRVKHFRKLFFVCRWDRFSSSRILANLSANVSVCAVFVLVYHHLIMYSFTVSTLFRIYFRLLCWWFVCCRVVVVLLMQVYAILDKRVKHFLQNIEKSFDGRLQTPLYQRLPVVLTRAHTVYGNIRSVNQRDQN